MNPRRRLWLALPLLAMGCDLKPAFHNTDLTGTRLGGDLNLADFHGRPRKLAEFHGRVVILFFGYTSCPDICPTALAKYAALLRRPDLPAERIQVIFVTLDPERDDAARLAGFLPWFHPDFIGLTGQPAEIDAVIRQFRITRERKEVGGGTGYTLDHSAGAYVFGPDGRLRLHLSENAAPDRIADDIRQLLAGK